MTIELKDGEKEDILVYNSMGLCEMTEVNKLKVVKPATLQLVGCLKGVPIVILVDIGANHNFDFASSVSDVGCKGRVILSQESEVG